MTNRNFAFPCLSCSRFLYKLLYFSNPTFFLRMFFLLGPIFLWFSQLLQSRALVERVAFFNFLVFCEKLQVFYGRLEAAHKSPVLQSSFFHVCHPAPSFFHRYNFAKLIHFGFAAVLLISADLITRIRPSLLYGSRIVCSSRRYRSARGGYFAITSILRDYRYRS